MKDIFSNLWDELGKTFRYVMPGFVILLLSYMFHREWFYSVNWNNWRHIIILTVIALVVGNVWYIIHRITVLEFINWRLYKRNEGYYLNNRHRCWKDMGYSVAHANFCYMRYLAGQSVPRFAEHIRFRIAHGQFAFIISEAIIVLTPFRLDYVAVAVMFVGVSGLAGSIAYHILSADMDAHLVEYQP